jgi:DNA polymerase
VSAHDEIREVVGLLRGLLGEDRDWGLEAPPLSASSLRYLEKGPGDPACLEDLREFIGECTRCKLSQGRTHLVFGEGAAKAKLVFVGEGPGREEDLAGRPFVGDSGRLLTDIIEKGFRLKREEVYICNVVKCRPPNNRDPETDEIETCLPFLKKQLNLIRPRVICTLGRIAAKALLGGEFRITQERGNWFSFMGIPLMPTFHPAYVQRNPSDERRLKKLVWEDVQKVMKELGLKVK